MASQEPPGAEAPGNSAIKQRAESSEVSQARFSPEEEKALLQESAAIKVKANELFNSGGYDTALVQYEEALASCPDYKHFERAVIHSNISACQIKLEDWRTAAKAATSALDTLMTLERELGLIPEAQPGPVKSAADRKADAAEGKDKKSTDEKDLEGLEAETASTAPEQHQFVPADVPDVIKNDIKRIRIKALLRRGRARAESGGWSNLSSAEEDYKALSKIPGLAAADAKTVRMQLVTLPPKTKAAQEKEMSEMWGKLRTLGDGILKPFGLSTNNFQMVKDEATGGYSMNFQGNQGS
ncbi:hypothetical protein NLG97_g11168 [Lecanicillium saksenae]|uniref:Uncharacterized protein n=1 Tax=Lecanicillium saksenae TaxID=468837 RepID=A0ACC1QE43_9HYPO|nr:hypothetical protein NLG97_g11168 [Lecanicillium saksenae]